MRWRGAPRPVLTVLAACAWWAPAAPAGAAGTDWLPLTCQAAQTVGMHDHPGAPEAFEAAVFVTSVFTLRENTLFMEHLARAEGGAPALYLTMTGAGGEETEFECRAVRGAGGAAGQSCVNNPPAEILMLNPEDMRFTRSAVGGWTFTATREGGASLFIEYGTCEPAAPAEAGADGG